MRAFSVFRHRLESTTGRHLAIPAASAGKGGRSAPVPRLPEDGRAAGPGMTITPGLAVRGADCAAQAREPARRAARRADPGARGFTLIEILIAIFILGIVLSTVYAAYTGTFRIIRDTGYDAEAYAMARSALFRMTRDLDNVVPYKGSFYVSLRKGGERDRALVELSFLSSSHIAFREKEPASGIAAIRYELASVEDREGYVLRRSDTVYSGGEAPDEEAQAGFVVCENVHSLTFELVDREGFMTDTWDSSSTTETQKKAAPVAVLIHLKLNNPRDPERPYVFSTQVYLPLNRVESDGQTT